MGAASPRRHPRGSGAPPNILLLRRGGRGEAGPQRSRGNWRDRAGQPSHHSGGTGTTPRGRARPRTRRSSPGGRRRPRRPPPLTTARTSAAMGPRRRFRRGGQPGTAPSARRLRMRRHEGAGGELCRRPRLAAAMAPSGPGRGARPEGPAAGGKRCREAEGGGPAVGFGSEGGMVANPRLPVSYGRPGPWWGGEEGFCFHSAAWQQREQRESSGSFLWLRLIWPFWLPHAGDGICAAPVPAQGLRGGSSRRTWQSPSCQCPHRPWSQHLAARSDPTCPWCVFSTCFCWHQLS